MAQDFAKKSRAGAKSGKRRPPNATTRVEPRPDNHWSWFFTGLLTGMLLSVLAYLGVTGAADDSLDPAAIAAQNDQGAGTNDPADDFEFYEYLPEAEVEVNIVPVEIASNNTRAASIEENPIHYLLQAGSFQARQDAEALRARIILLNMDAQIVPAILSGRTWYRVQAGPFIGRAGVEKAENTLIANDIDPIRLRVGSR